MKAMMCDRCGKVVLLDDEPNLFDIGINALYIRKTNENIDLCDECVDELRAAVRKVNDHDI